MFSRGKKIKIIKWNAYDWKQFTFGTILGIITSICGALLPFFVQQTEIIFKSNKSTNEIINNMLLILLFMVLIGILGIINSFFSKIFLSKLSARQLAKIREQMFDNIQKTSLKDIQKQNRGSLLSCLTIDIFNFSLYYNWMIINVFPSALRWLVFSIVVFMFNYLIGFLLLGLSIILYLISYLMSRKSIKYFGPSLAKIDRLNIISKENIVGARVIRAFNLKHRQIERFNKINSEFETLSIKAETRAFMSWPFAISFVNASAIIIILVFSQIHWSGINFAGTHIDIGTIYATFSYAYLILWSVYDFAFLYIYDARSATSRNRIFEILNLKNSLLVNDGCDFELDEIKFDNVSLKFNEQNEEFILKNINLNIPKGSKVGIIGPTGSGKTSFLNLIPRLFDVSSGQILVNSTNIKKINTSSLLQNISYAFQQKYLFSGSIKENILLSNDNLSNDDIWKILEIVQLDSFIKSKKEGLNFQLEEYGNNLSGGQKQRLNIARAIAKKAQIYIFDDSMSALDNLTEKHVLKGINQVTKNATVFISSQKISTIKNLDFIIVLDKGGIKGVGKHSELISNCQIYQDIYMLQTKGDQNE